ncbi:MAG: tetratricopeptide repeat protein [Candidatus Heimdallarchaeota archaeon]
MATVKVLAQIEELISQDKFKDALQAVNQLKESIESSDDWQSIYQLLALEVEIQYNLGGFQELKELIDQIFKEFQRLGQPIQAADILLNICEFFFRMGKHIEGVELTRDVESLLGRIDIKQQPTIKMQIARLTNYRGIYWRELGECEKALNTHRRSLALFKEIEDKRGITYALLNLSLDYANCKGNIDRMFEYAQQCLALAEEIGDKKTIAFALNLWGVYHDWKRESAKALEYFQRSLALREEIGDKFHVAGMLINLAFFSVDIGELDVAEQHCQRSISISREIGAMSYLAFGYEIHGYLLIHRGDYSHALESFNLSLEIYKEQGQQGRIGNTLALIGVVYRELGAIDEAMAYYQESLPYLEKSDLLEHAVNIGDLGILYWQKGELDTAFKYLQKSLGLIEDLGHEHSRMNRLFSLVLLCLDLNDLKEAQIYFQLLHPDPEKTMDKLHSQLSRVAEALILKTSGRTLNRGKAEELLQNVVNEETLQHSLTVLAMLHLCDLKLKDLRSMEKDLDLLNEIQILLENLVTISKSHRSFRLLAETYILQSKLALFELDINRSQNLLGQAQMLAEEKGLRMLASKIIEERKQLTTQMSRWEEYIQKKVLPSEIEEFIRIDEFIENMVQNRLFPRDLDVLQYAREARLAIQKGEQKS